MSYHKLLSKQIAKYLPVDLQERPDMKKFLAVISESYKAHERDIELAERAHSISEEEYIEINQQLAHELKVKKLSVEKLKEALGTISGEEKQIDSDDLLIIARYINQQVSKRKNAEKVFTSLITNMQSGILLEDENNEIVFTNQLYCDMFHMPATPEILQGTNCSSGERSKHLFKYPEQFVNDLKKILSQKRLITAELLEMADGRIYERDFIPIYSENIFKGQLWSYTDITERKKAQDAIEQSELKNRLIMNAALDAIITMDNEGHITFWNPQAEKIFGWRSQEVMGKEFSEIILPTQSRQAYKGRIKHSLKAGTGNILDKQAELTAINKCGHELLIEMSMIPVEQGDTSFICSFIRNITAQKELELELINAKEVAEASTRAKEMFLANMSHEIRTPMNAIMGMANQLGKTMLDKDQKFYLNTINSAADNLLIIINDILDLSKIEAGKLTIENIGFEPKAVIERVMQVMIHKAEEKGLSLTNEFCDVKLSPVLIGDPYRINQILLNLISNSLKFTEKGTVDISCRVIDDKLMSQTVCITVRDTGIGMDKSFVKNLFQKFTQEDESVTRRFGGTGLGMSICKQLIELLNGTIQVESEKGIGTTVTLTLPFSKGIQAHLQKKDAGKLPLNTLSGKKILVTDDNEMNRLVATTILKHYGAVIKEAQNGIEAIDRINGELFDLVLMDIQMPVMDGLEATKLIRENISKELPIIALTALALKDDESRFLDAGMNDYLSKPFKEDQLINVISRWINKSSSDGQNASSSEKENFSHDLKGVRVVGKEKQVFTDEHIELFIHQAPALIKEIIDAYETNDFIKVNRTAHRLRASVNTVGMGSLKNEILEIELSGEEEQKTERFKTLITQLNRSINQVVDELKLPEQGITG